MCLRPILSGEEGVENVTGFIERDSNGVTLEVANIGCYSEVLAYEVTTRSRYQLAPEDRASISSELCPISTGEKVWLQCHQYR